MIADVGADLALPGELATPELARLSESRHLSAQNLARFPVSRHMALIAHSTHQTHETGLDLQEVTDETEAMRSRVARVQSVGGSVDRRLGFMMFDV